MPKTKAAFHQLEADGRAMLIAGINGCVLEFAADVDAPEPEGEGDETEEEGEGGGDVEYASTHQGYGIARGGSGEKREQARGYTGFILIRSYCLIWKWENSPVAGRMLVSIFLM